MQAAISPVLVNITLGLMLRSCFFRWKTFFVERTSVAANTVCNIFSYSSLLSFPGRGRGGLRGGRLRGGRERHHHRGPHAHAHKQELQQLGAAPNSAAIEVFCIFFLISVGGPWRGRHCPHRHRSGGHEHHTGKTREGYNFLKSEGRIE